MEPIVLVDRVSDALVGDEGEVDFGEAFSSVVGEPEGAQADPAIGLGSVASEVSESDTLPFFIR